MLFNVLRHSPTTGFFGAEAVHVEGFEAAKEVAEEAARNQALPGRMLYQYHMVDLDGREASTSTFIPRAVMVTARPCSPGRQPC
jgi:hypothetical protein